MEDKLNQAHLEVQQLKASVKNYEGMIDNYKSQVGPWYPRPPTRAAPLSWPGDDAKPRGLCWGGSGVDGVFRPNTALSKPARRCVGPQVMKTRLEADEVAAQLERCDKENKMLKDEMNKEIEAVLLPVLAAQLHVRRPVPLVCLHPPLLWTAKLTSFLTAGCSPHCLRALSRSLSLISSRCCCFISSSLLVFFLSPISLKKKSLSFLEHPGGFKSTCMPCLFHSIWCPYFVPSRKCASRPVPPRALFFWRWCGCLEAKGVIFIVTLETAGSRLSHGLVA